MQTKSELEMIQKGKKCYNSPFLKACRREETSYTPVWLMRQAGRYMKEYRDVRAKYSFLELCKNKELIAKVTVEAAEILNVDAAIIFSDILLILQPMGLGLEYVKGDGPAISGKVTDLASVEKLHLVDPEDSLSFLYDGIKLTRKELKEETPLIGFSGAPFTLASYILEGGGSKNYLEVKKLMYNSPLTWHALMEKIVQNLIPYLQAQVNAGADALQIFDSWVGCLSEAEFMTFVYPHSQKLFKEIQGIVPVIHFGTGNGHFIEKFAEAGGDVIGVDGKTNLGEAWKRIGYDKAVQGNLDSALLYCNQKAIEKEAHRILKEADGRPGHIFNLGHGILPTTPVENVKALVQIVHEFKRS